MITIKDKQFELFIHHEQIADRVAALAERLNADYEGKTPILIAILNGAFMFAADLVRHLTFDHEIQFAKFSSYVKMDTTGKVKELIGLNIDIANRDVIIVEDIIDTGITMHHLLPQLKAKGVKSVEIATLLMKPNKLKAHGHKSIEQYHHKDAKHPPRVPL